MADIRAKLIGLCEAFNAHDLNRIVNFFAVDCILEMPRGLTPRALAMKESRRCVKVSPDGLKGCRTFTMPIVSISWMQICRPAYPSGLEDC
jgi:hypothetical protein